MRKPNVAIAIPIYKPTPSDNELLSLRQCFQIFAKRDIYLVCPNSLDITFYTNEAQKYNYHNLKAKRFKDNYFEGIEGYNKLMLSLKFYKSFKEYEFIQIYQLDAWVFRDELDYWCDKGYDYIGAPYFVGWGTPTLEHISGGNGGFSLRHINNTMFFLRREYYLKKLSLKKTVSNKILVRLIRKLFKYIFKIHDYDSMLRLFERNEINEDYHFSHLMPRVFNNFNVAPYEVALKYSFETNPSFLYRVNHSNLPFGCHAWEKYEPEFWGDFIH